jgi:hypothetical protein
MIYSVDDKKVSMKPIVVLIRGGTSYMPLDRTKNSDNTGYSTG